METLLHIGLGLLGLSFIVLIHEFGHFAAARCCKVEVERLCLFLGKPLVSWKWGRTEFGIAWLPLGGYCKMKDEGLPLQGPSPNASISPQMNLASFAASAAGQKSFAEASPLQKIFIAFAGPLINILFAFVVLFLFELGGYPAERESNRIVVFDTSELQDPNALPQVPSPAELAGLRSGDQITRIGRQQIRSFSDLRLAIALNGGETLALEFLRNGKPQRSQIQPASRSTDGSGWIGVAPWQELIVQNIAEPSAAYRAGLRPGMRLEQLNGQKVLHWNDLLRKLRDLQILQSAPQGKDPKKPQTVSLLWRSKNDAAPLQMELSLAEMGQLDFSQKIWRRSANPWLAGPTAAQQLGEVFSLQIQSLARLLSGRLSLKENLAGPIRISDQIGQVMAGSPNSGLAERWYSSWRFLSLISFLIGLANLLPLAVLDGGQILLYSIELITRRRLSARLVQAYHLLGGILAIGLMAAIFSLEFMYYLP